MTTVVQTSYRPQIAPAVVGMIATEVGWDAITRLCVTATGIPFGVAVSQDTSDKGAVIGGTKFLGITCRDITLDRIPIDPLAAAGTLAGLDVYPQYSNMGVLTRGQIWVLAHANVIGGDPLFYETTGGTLGNSGSGLAASGQVAYTSSPANNDQLVINGTTWTWVNTLTTGNQLLIKGTLGDTIAGAAATLNASADTFTSALKYASSPPSPGGAGQGSGANTLTYGDKTVGTAGNAIAVTTTTAGATVTPMAGGSAAATAVPNGFWVQSAIAGQLAKVSLAIQR